ncbi:MULTISPECIES: TetR/AcrR family transcriptional regulator [Mesoflavibacter]|uniref:TetR/AcrR family transcriptional regulator n=1 Tax=Mesoflavibacter profundi TaxID=2708110 RepID=A0ABT4S2C5_9FLAO|nr:MULTISPECIES: TetR/AcrR family transcriptional regulator [Mesoflavibacter]MDA0178224.1 TetR/AcrR family transcriptional regulator [Mesoflavibacter profundi]QIJ89186.1 Transcriptional regulator, AcrR family [Mesoflavibacter sp. HG96]QIJ91914.1 Transcriptional regulator, AcrR family [Mesoflavibacter sp. HG37]
MREKILDKSADLFLNYGFKSVTMDDIANALGISKKTIYQHFDNKTKLVEATTLHMFHIISEGINCICALEKNPIEEIYEIKRFVMEHLKDEKSSPQHQLQKYYPKIFESLKSKQYCVMEDCVINNLNRGVNSGLYRKTIDIQFICRLYFNSMMSLKDKELFPLKNFSMNMLMDNFLEYHVRGICTPKGLDILNGLIETNQS